MKTLKRPLESISFYERERMDGKYVRNKCGRDFLYYALHYYFPEKHNADIGNPVQIEQQRLFGMPVPALLALLQIQFKDVPKYFNSLGLELFINNKKVQAFHNFIDATLRSKISFSEAIKQIKHCVDTDVACAIDMPVGGGLLVYFDHVMFVYGYDEKHLYVFDTHPEQLVPYEQVSEGPFYFRLPIEEIEKKWSFTGRVWRVERKRVYN